MKLYFNFMHKEKKVLTRRAELCTIFNPILISTLKKETEGFFLEQTKLSMRTPLPGPFSQDIAMAASILQANVKG